MLSFPLLGRPRSWAVLCLFSVLSFFAFSIPCAAQYPGGGSGGGYPGGGVYSGPVYTGGTVTSTFVSAPPSNYSLYSDGTYGGSSYAGGTNSGGYPTSSTVTCSGGIQATFTWYNGGDANSPPPKCIIVTEHCIVHWATTSPGSPPGGGTVTGNCTNPLGGSSVPDNPGPGATWEYTRYTVQNNPPANLVISCSPEADATAAAGSTPSSSIACIASVKYKVDVSPVTIDLKGVTTDPSDKSLHALTGQQVTALLNPPLPASNFSWSFTGATGYNPFRLWDPGASSSATQFITLSSADLTQSAISFYDAHGDTVTVNCAATLTPPSGPSLTVNVASKSITYHKPDVSWTVGQPFTDPNGYLLKPGFVNNPQGGSFAARELWGPMKITEPALFTATNSPGLGAILQIANLSRSNTRVPLNNLPSTYTKLSIIYTNGSTGAVASPTGLDVAFPYPYGYFQNPNGTFSFSDGAWLASNNGFSGDGPVQPYMNHHQDGGGDAWNAASASDRFNTWIMYMPSIKDNQGVIYVPLQTLTWNWGGNASLNHLGFWDVNENPPFSPGNPGKTDTYPS